MNVRLLSLLFVVFFYQCASNKSTSAMQSAPENKAKLLGSVRGIEALADEPLVLEKYTQTRSLNAAAVKVFENGDVYEITMSRNSSLEGEFTVYRKVKTLDKGGLERLKNIIKDHAIPYAQSPSQKMQDKPTSSTHWYFHLDKEHYAYSQEQRFLWDPKFVRKLNRVIK